jgi:hypothetical protein
MKRGQVLMMSDAYTSRSGVTSCLQFGLDMCQASLLAEGNLLGSCWETSRRFEACAMRKIKSEGQGRKD